MAREQDRTGAPTFLAIGPGSGRQPVPPGPRILEASISGRLGEEEGSARGRAEGKVPFVTYLAFLSYRQCSGSRIFLWTLLAAHSLVVRDRGETTIACGTAQCRTGCLGSERIR